MKNLKKYSAFLVLLTLIFSSCASFFSGVDFDSFQDDPVYRDKFTGIWVLDTSNQGPALTTASYGRWVSDAMQSGDYNTFEFKADGTCIIVWYRNNNVFQTWAARYKVSSFQIVFSFEQRSDVRRANYVFVDNNTLSLTNWSNTDHNQTYKKRDSVHNEIENALKKAADTVISTLQRETIIAIVNISSDDIEVSEFIAGELEFILVNNGFNVVDRSELDRIRQEQNFQLSADVDDTSAVSIGKFAGANIVITGAVTGSGNMRRLRLRALDTQTARVVGSASEALLDRTSSRQTGAASSGAASHRIGDRGPAGGIVFYDKGEFSDGWRYLEAAPANTEFRTQWWGSEYRFSWIGEQGYEIGDGKWNTRNISGFIHRDYWSSSNIAAVKCAALNYNGFNDWFLPSKDELNLMFINLHQRGLGGFRTIADDGLDILYCSSSRGNIDIGYPWKHRFKDGLQSDAFEYSARSSVRAVRAF